MATKTILVTAKMTSVDEVFSYEAREYTEIYGKKSFYHKKPYEPAYCDHIREIIFEIDDTLNWRTSSDCVYNYSVARSADKPYESHSIACDDVGNDMLEVAMAEAYPGAYSKRNQKLDESDKEQWIREHKGGYINPLGMAE